MIKLIKKYIITDSLCGYLGFCLGFRYMTYMKAWLSRYITMQYDSNTFESIAIKEVQADRAI